MNRDRIIYATVLIAVFGACFAVYQFYFKAKLEKYAQDKELLENLNAAYTGLNTTFRDEDPDVVIAKYSSVVEAWREAIEARVTYFNDVDWREHEKPPEDVFILQFWYGEQTREMTTALWEKAQAKYGAEVYQRFPLDVQTMLGVAYAEQWQGYDITKELVTGQLERLSYGISVFELLMDHNAKVIRQVSLYDNVPSGFIGSDVEYARVGLSFVMEVKDLVALVETMRSADRYFSIEGMKVSHPYLGVRYEPQMEVEMFLLRTKPTEKFLTGASVTLAQAGASPSGGLAAAASGGAPAPGTAQGAYNSQFSLRADDADDRGRVVEPPPTGLKKAWRWFKRTVLFTN